MRQALQAQLDASSKALASDLSDAAAQRVLLETLVRCTDLLEANVTVPAYNTPNDSVRSSVFNVYHRVARLLGRNTQEAVAADTKAMLISMGDRIAFRPGKGNRDLHSPSNHIQTVIAPLLDQDMRTHAFKQSMYSFDGMKNFYNLIKTWRFEGRELGEIQTSTRP